MHSEDPSQYAGEIAAMDWLTFYSFFLGVFKDPRKVEQNQFYFTFAMIAFTLVLERQSINWLSNRKGLTYNRLQKFIELDLRVQAIKQKWPQQPKYDIDMYRDHYFFHDFDELKRRFEMSLGESNEERRAGKYSRTENTDFIPYKVACRIRDFITFSVKLAGRCPDLKFKDSVVTEFKFQWRTGETPSLDLTEQKTN
jgi:hypothetical protein